MYSDDYAHNVDITTNKIELYNYNGHWTWPSNDLFLIPVNKGLVFNIKGEGSKVGITIVHFGASVHLAATKNATSLNS